MLIYRSFLTSGFLLLASLAVYSQEDFSVHSVLFNNLGEFADPPKNWVICGDALADPYATHDLRPVKGEGVVVDDFSKNNRMHLYTKEEFGDLEVHLDFMMAKGSNSGVYLQGRYEIQLLDSWTRSRPSWSDAGAIYSRWNPQRGSFEGTPPVMNVAKAPGLWQHLDIFFRAPRFNADGQKIRNARFDAVYYNGVLVQQGAFVTGPTASSMFQDEKAEGPLVLQGDHGPVAFKNISYRRMPPPGVNDDSIPAIGYWETRNPVEVQTDARPYLLRSFLNFGKKEITHAVSAGYPGGVNCSYDLKQGAIMQIWRGKFLDVTRMWVGRGEPQLAIPMGSVIRLTDAPALAVLPDSASAWPDSVAFDDLQHHGYRLDNKGNPIFSYTINGVAVSDSVAVQNEGQGLVRSITVRKPAANSYLRLAAGVRIEKVGPSRYAIDGKSYYISTANKTPVMIRKTESGQELLAEPADAVPFTYSIIW